MIEYKKKILSEANAKMIKKLFPGLPVLKGESVTLRPLTLDDADGLSELTSCEEVYRYLPTFLFEKKYDDAHEVINRLYDECLEKSLILGVFTGDSFCGLVELYGYRAAVRKISLGQRLLPQYHGKGIAPETLDLIIDYIFNEIGIKLLTTSAMPDNKASEGSLKKQGFKRIARSVPENWGHPLPTLADKWIMTASDYHKLCNVQADK